MKTWKKLWNHFSWTQVRKYRRTCNTVLFRKQAPHKTAYCLTTLPNTSAFLNWRLFSVTKGTAIKSWLETLLVNRCCEIKNAEQKLLKELKYCYSLSGKKLNVSAEPSFNKVQTEYKKIWVSPKYHIAITVSFHFLIRRKAYITDEENIRLVQK